MILATCQTAATPCVSDLVLHTYSKEAFQYLSFDILTFFFLVKLQHFIIMDMPPDMKKHLMQMAGITG